MDAADEPRISENPPENPEPNNPPAENPAPPPPPDNNEPVNQIAQVVSAADLIPARGRGRPKGSKTKNRRSPDGKFVSGPADLPPPADGHAAPQFISEIPGEPAPGGGVTDQAAVSQPAPGTPAPPAPVDYKATAQLTVGMGTATLATIFGPEWNPENEAEKEQLVFAVALYLETKQVSDIPPGALLAIVLLTYSAKRLHQPKTKGRLIQFWLWMKSKFSRRKPGVIIPMPKPYPAPSIVPEPEP